MKYQIKYTCLKCHAILSSKGEPLECHQDQGGCGKRRNQTVFQKIFLPKEPTGKTNEAGHEILNILNEDEDGDYISQREFVCKDIVQSLDIKTTTDNNNIHYYEDGIYLKE